MLIWRLEANDAVTGQKPAAMRIRIAFGERQRAHDVSILIIEGWRLGRCIGWQLGAKICGAGKWLSRLA